MRVIPKTMVTQHPDNAAKAFWLGKSFINVRDELKECFTCFSELGCDEFMWDWEGKHVDEAVIERLIEESLSFFQKRTLGHDIFLTYRLPNIWIEKGSYRILRAFANILNAYDIFKDLNLPCPPIFEVILPMVTKAEQLLFLQKKFAALARFVRDDSSSRLGSGNPAVVETIPLVEDTTYMIKIDQLLREYVRQYQKSELNKIRKLKYIRPFIARSDPALNYGFISAVLGSKVGLSRVYEFERSSGIRVYPILGCGGVPFRGHLTPTNIPAFLKEYQGFQTVTLQSSFRYDFPVETVKRSIKQLHRALSRPLKKPILPAKDIAGLEEMIGIFKKHYRSAVAGMTVLINGFSGNIPRRRERKLHIGLFGYSRGFRKGVVLPRAITFTAALYSLGIPPEIIGTGRALVEIRKLGRLDLLNQYHLNLGADLGAALGYVNLENIRRLEKKYPAMKEILQDLKGIENVLGLPAGPQTRDELIHKNLSANILLYWEQGKDVTALVEEAGILRKFLG